MRHIFFKAEGFVSGRSLPQLNNVEYLIPNYELDAYAHWIFGASTDSLIDVVNNKQLTLKSGATVQPVFDSTSVMLSTLPGNALISDLSDDSNNNYTLAAVVCGAGAANSLSVILGNLAQTAVSSGAGLYLEFNAFRGNIRPTINTSYLIPGNGDTSIVLNSLNPFFAAISVNKSTKTMTVFTEQDGISHTRSITYNENYVANNNKFALGNSVMASQTSERLMKYMEAVFFDKALSVEEIQGLASRSKLRMSNKGLSF